MAKRAEDDYLVLAMMALALPSPQQREAQLVLSEVNKWRQRDEEDEKEWLDAGPGD